MTMITPSYLGETIEYSSLHACRSTLEDPTPYAWLQHFGSRLVEVQLQQSDGIADHHWAFTAEHNAVGRIDPARVLETLESAGAGTVDLIFEIIPGWEDPDDRVIADLVDSVDQWRDAIDARGLGA